MVRFQQSMRWYGPEDPVSLSDIRQAGCTAVVTALHHIPTGAVWPVEEIEKRKAVIAAAGMEWKVVESLPVHEAIKTQRAGYEQLIRNYQLSLQHLADCGITVVTYNFMPVLDWMRTDPAFTLPDGSKALRFEKLAFIAFELFLLQRPGAEAGYTRAEIAGAEALFLTMAPEKREQLFRHTLLGLPGEKESFSPAQILEALQPYAGVDAAALQQHLKYFLQQVVPVAEAAGIRLAIHPDDPPYPILGLPRIVSTAADLEFIMKACPSPANGLCFCTGSLGVRPDNDLEELLDRYGEQVHFVHLRNTRRDAAGNFFEADHLDGDTDMFAVVKKLVELMQQTGVALPMRPDHGHQMLDDLHKITYPGYSAIGRLKGLAELRGLEMGIGRSMGL